MTAEGEAEACGSAHDPGLGLGHVGALGYGLNSSETCREWS
jgi:hypothetical protein